jgi:Holliday junction resolvase
MPSPSKAKGNSFERQTADFLTELYGEKFIRAPGSGAYIGGKNTHRKQLLHDGQIRNFKSDIVPGESFQKLNAECKSYKDFPFHQLFTGNVKILETWIDQCMTAADPGDFNIILMKFNRKGTYVAVKLINNHNLKLTHYIEYDSKNYGIWAIMDHDIFWELNAVQVKNLCL